MRGTFPPRRRYWCAYEKSSVPRLATGRQGNQALIPHLSGSDFDQFLDFLPEYNTASTQHSLYLCCSGVAWTMAGKLDGWPEVSPAHWYHCRSAQIPCRIGDQGWKGEPFREGDKARPGRGFPTVRSSPEARQACARTLCPLHPLRLFVSAAFRKHRHPSPSSAENPKKASWRISFTGCRTGSLTTPSQDV